MTSIPKTIHYCWLSDDPVPESMQRYMETWRKLKGYEFVKWDRQRFDLEAHPWARGAFAAKKYAFAADQVRLYALYHHGGVYLDMDIEVVKSFDSLLKNSFMLATEFDDYGIEAGCMGAVKGDPFIKECLDYYEEREFVEGEVLPVLMRRVMERSFPERIKQLKSKDYFTAKDYFTGLIKKTRNTRVIHHYAGSWKEKTTSDKEWVHLRWGFFKRNGDSQDNIDFFKQVEALKEKADRLDALSPELAEAQEYINSLAPQLITNTSSKRMLRVIAHRMMDKVSQKLTGFSAAKKTSHTIHFISRLDQKNIGDIFSSPLRYHATFFQRRYAVVQHDIYSVDFSQIAKDDVIILGGGGLLYCLDEWQKTINQLFDSCNTVIGWGIGFNTHYDTNQSLTPLDISRFALLGLRDYNYLEGPAYCPCVSALAVQKVANKAAQKGAGIIQHEAFPIEGPDFDNLDRATNNTDFDSMIQFILEHKAIVTNSYHAAYWSQLLQRKVVIVNPTSVKFEHFKYQPMAYTGKINEDIDKAAIYPEALTDALAQNRTFFKQVKNLL